VIFGPLITDAERYIDEGTFWDLTPYIEEWAPAYWKWLQDHPDYARAMRTDKGRYFGFGFFREAGGWNDTYLGPVVNKAWLDETGLPMPVTVSDWDRTLRAFRKKYGVGLSFAWDMVGNGTVISGAWGAQSFANFKLFVDENHKVQLANVQPEYGNQLAQFAEWWRDGLIDQDFLSINNTMARSNAANLRMGISVTTMGQLSNWIQDAKSQNTGAQWVGLQYPTGDDGTLSQVSGGLGIGSGVAVISTSTPPEKLELVMRALDYAYTDEGNLFWNFGKRGVSWDYDGAGKPAFLPLVTEDPNGLNDAVDKYSGATWSGNCIQATALLYMKNSAEAIDANNLWFYPNEAVTYPSRLPWVTLTADESTRAGVLSASIQTYVDEMAIQFITGRAGFDTWDSYVATVRSMGMDELLGIYQAALDRYLAR
jgi:putative aldouronate transport system substrate-binding protein